MQHTIGYILSEINDIGLREAYQKSLVFLVCVARLTPIELLFVDECYRNALSSAIDVLQFEDQIFLFIQSLRSSGVRPNHYWDYLLFVE